MTNKDKYKLILNISFIGILIYLLAISNISILTKFRAIVFNNLFIVLIIVILLFILKEKLKW